MIKIDYKKIMIATDGSDFSNLAIDKGIELARLSGGTVYAVYVISTAYSLDIDGINYSSVGTNPYWGSIRKALKNQGQQAVDNIKGLGEAKGINVKSVLLEGNPSDELIRYADTEKNGYRHYGHSRKDRIRQDTSRQCCRKVSPPLESSCHGCREKSMCFRTNLK